jgi:hypothetical protein
MSFILNNRSSLYTPLLKLSVDDIHIEVFTCPEILSIKTDVSLM